MPTDDSEAAWIASYLQPRHPDLVAAYAEACEMVAAARAAGQLTAAQAAQAGRLISVRRRPPPCTTPFVPGATHRSLL